MTFYFFPFSVREGIEGEELWCKGVVVIQSYDYMSVMISGTGLLPKESTVDHCHMKWRISDVSESLCHSAGESFIHRKGRWQMVLCIQRLWTTAAIFNIILPTLYKAFQTTAPEVITFLLSSYKEWPKELSFSFFVLSSLAVSSLIPNWKN